MHNKRLPAFFFFFISSLTDRRSTRVLSCHYPSLLRNDEKHILQYEYDSYCLVLKIRIIFMRCTCGKKNPQKLWNEYTVIITLSSLLAPWVVCDLFFFIFCFVFPAKKCRKEKTRRRQLSLSFSFLRGEGWFKYKKYYEISGAMNGYLHMIHMRVTTFASQVLFFPSFCNRLWWVRKFFLIN